MYDKIHYNIKNLKKKGAAAGSFSKLVVVLSSSCCFVLNSLKSPLHVLKSKGSGTELNGVCAQSLGFSLLSFSSS